MDERPVLKINGIRYKAKRLKMGAYRQITMLADDVGNLSSEEFQDEAQCVIRLAFDLTADQADGIDVADILPTFRALMQWAQKVFTAKVQQLPNAEGPEAAD